MKKFKIILLAGVTVAGIWLSGCSKSKDKEGAAVSSEPPAELKQKWQVGKRYENHLEMNQVSRLDIPGVPTPVTKEVAMSEDLAMSALKALPGGATGMEMEFKSLKIEGKVGGAIAMSFDSKDDPKNDQTNSAVLRQIVGARFNYLMDAAGKAGNVTGMEEFLARVPPGDVQAQAMLKSMMNEDLIKQMAMRGQGLPDKQMKVGDQWPMHLDENAGPLGIMQMDMKYTFKGWEQHDGRKCALIEFTGELGSKPGATSGAATISVDKGAIQGREWFDPEFSMITDTTTEQAMTMKIVNQDKTINSEIKQTLSMKLVNVVDIAK